MDFYILEKYLSQPRMNRYMIASGNSKEKAVKLYINNLRVSQAFHPMLGLFEVILRNCLHDILAKHFEDNDWILNQKNGFMSDASLTYIYKRSDKLKTNDFLKREIEKAEKRITKANISVSSGKIIAEQTLGFWTSFFDVPHYRLLNGKPIKIFTSLPKGIGRKEINNELDNIRRFRNRINHNEPICFDKDRCDFKVAEEVYKSLVDLLFWINPEILVTLEKIDNISKTIEFSKSENNF